MDYYNLDRIKEVIDKLVRTVNGEPREPITPSEAYIAIRVIDLTEGFIRHVKDSYIFDHKWESLKEKENR